MMYNLTKSTLCFYILILSMIWSFTFLPVRAEDEPAGDYSFVEDVTIAVLTFSKDTIEETQAGSGYSISGTALTVFDSGTYYVTGTCLEGSIIVKGSAQDVTLILEDLDLTSASTAPLLIKKNAQVTVRLDGDNVLVDNEMDPESPDYEGAVIKINKNASVQFFGQGSLTVNGNVKNGIKAGESASVSFESGTYTINAEKNGIAADSSLVFNGGDFTVRSKNDGIKVAPDTEDNTSAGRLIIYDGTFDIKAKGDGIQAEQIMINGGVFDIQTFGGYQTSEFDSDTMSAKGIKVSGDREDKEFRLTIKDGTFTLNCRDDAIHSDGDIEISAGTFEIKSGDDGVHADNTLILGEETEEGEVTLEQFPFIEITNCVEGLEARLFQAYSGQYRITALDDGMNSTDGVDQNLSEAPGCDLIIYGGKYYIDAGGDGLDSNGEIHLYGGTLEIFTSPVGPNAPLDANGKILIDGATVFSAGLNRLNDVDPSFDSQSYVRQEGNYPSGTTVSITSETIVLYEIVLPKTAGFLFFSAPDLPRHALIKVNGITGGNGSNQPGSQGGNGSSSGESGGGVGAVVSDNNPVYLTADSDFEHGRVTSDVTSAKAGDIVTVTVTPDEGYKIDSVKVTDKNGKDVTVTDNGDGTYSFKMPSVGVTAEPIFIEDGEVPLAGRFVDVPEEAYFYDPVEWAVGKCITNGIDGIHFGPDNSCTRAQIVTFLWRAAGCPEPTTADNPFMDVEAGSYYEKAVLWAMEKGITTGTSETTFSPNATVTRGQSVTFLYRYDGQKTDAEIPFEDVEDGAYYEEAVQWAVSEEITNGTSETTFEPDSPCTRGQIVTFLYRDLAE